METKRYIIDGALLCHDVRLNTTIRVIVELDHYPSEQEALRLLWPAADAEVARHWCEDCPYDIYSVEIKEAAG